MTDLVTMEGNKHRLGHEFSLLKLMGNKNDLSFENVNPWELSNQAAGIQLLYKLTKEAPGVTWGDLFKIAQIKKLSGPEMGSLESLWRKTKNLIKEPLNYLGDKSGSAVRLLTDKEVSEGISNYAATLSSGGMSSAASDMFGGILDPKIAEKVLGLFGKNNKVNTASIDGTPLKINPMYIMGGVGLLTLIVLIAGKK